MCVGHADTDATTDNVRCFNQRREVLKPRSINAAIRPFRHVMLQPVRRQDATAKRHASSWLWLLRVWRAKEHAAPTQPDEGAQAQHGKGFAVRGTREEEKSG